MSWTYTRATDAPRMEHTAGTVPARPLEVGDIIQWPTTWNLIVATTDTLLQVQGGRMPLFRAPVSGDYSECIGAVQ